MSNLNFVKGESFLELGVFLGLCWTYFSFRTVFVFMFCPFFQRSSYISKCLVATNHVLAAILIAPQAPNSEEVITVGRSVMQLHAHRLDHQAKHMEICINYLSPWMNSGCEEPAHPASRRRRCQHVPIKIKFVFFTNLKIQ